MITSLCEFQASSGVSVPHPPPCPRPPPPISPSSGPLLPSPPPRRVGNLASVQLHEPHLPTSASPQLLLFLPLQACNHMSNMTVVA